MLFQLFAEKLMSRSRVAASLTLTIVPAIKLDADASNASIETLFDDEEAEAVGTDNVLEVACTRIERVAW